MEFVNLEQGTPEWEEFRRLHYPASEAPVVMGCGKYEPKTPENLALMRIGAKEYEVSEYQQKIFDEGHRSEAYCRPLIEGIIGEPLSPVTAKKDMKLNMEMSASFDGLTFEKDILFEHKWWNEDLAKQVKAKKLDGFYHWQLEQQLLVSGAKKVIFVTSDSFRVDSYQEAEALKAEGKIVSDQLIDPVTGQAYYAAANHLEYMEYKPVRGRAKKLVEGWKKYEEIVGKVLFEGGEWDKLTARMIPLLTQQDELNAKLEEIKSQLSVFKEAAISYATTINTNKVACNGIEFTKSFRKGSLDEDKISKKLKVDDLEDFRKEGSVSWRITRVSEKRLTDEQKQRIAVLKKSQESKPKKTVRFIAPQPQVVTPGAFAF